MAQLRASLESMGFTDVQTVLNSGNAVFKGPPQQPQAIALSIHGVLRQQLGLDVLLVVLRADDLTAILAGNPFPDAIEQPSRLLIAVTPDRSNLQSLAALTPMLSRNDRFQVTDQAAYLFCPDGILKSRAGEALLGKRGKLFTTRNWSTFQKLAAKLALPPAS